MEAYLIPTNILLFMILWMLYAIWRHLNAIRYNEVAIRIYGEVAIRPPYTD